MKVFVTGASGFLGNRLVRRLVREGWEVSALVRSDSSGATIRQLGAKPVEGSLASIPEWKDELQGHEVVIHCAAPVEFWGQWERFYAEITLATKTLLQSCADAGVKRFVYISSESVLQDTTPLTDIDETFPYADSPNSYYGKAKKLAEIEILASQTTVHCVILRPTFIWGKGMKALDEIGRKIQAGQFIWVGDGETVIEMVHVDNVVEAIVLSCSKGRNKGIYFVTDDNPTTVRKLLTALLDTKGIVPPDKSLPNPLVKLASSMAESIWRLLRLKNPPPICRFEWSFVGLPRRYDLSRAKQELGYKPVVSFEAGLKEMASCSPASCPDKPMTLNGSGNQRA